MGCQKLFHLQALHLPATHVKLHLKLHRARRGSDTELVQHDKLFQGFLASKEVVTLFLQRVCKGMMLCGQQQLRGVGGCFGKDWKTPR